MKFNIGDRVVLVSLPKGLDRLPADTQRAFQVCLNRHYAVIDITEDGLYVLDVSKDVDPIIGGKYNDIRVEEEHLRAA